MRDIIKLMENNIDNNLDSLRAFFLENVSKFCDKCGTGYLSDNIDVVSETHSSVIIQAECGNCKSIYMAHIVKPLQMTKKIPIRLDIPHTKLRDYYELGPISSDELLALRKKLPKVKTLADVAALFGQKKKRTRKVKKIKK